MAADGLFFRGAGILNRQGVPGRALAVQGIYTSLLCLSGTYSNLLDYVIGTVLLFYLLSIAAIFIFRRKMPDAARPYKAVGYPVIQFLYMGAVGFIMVILALFKPYYTWPGFIIVTLGIPVFYLWKRYYPVLPTG
jgi:APA family basic amino acid/polyamine antiporter